MGKKPFSDKQELDKTVSDNMKMVLEKHKRQDDQVIDEDHKIFEDKFKKQEVPSSSDQTSPLNRYVSIEPAMQRLQRDAENIAAMDKKDQVSAADVLKEKAKKYKDKDVKEESKIDFEFKAPSISDFEKNQAGENIYQKYQG